MNKAFILCALLLAIASVNSKVVIKTTLARLNEYEDLYMPGIVNSFMQTFQLTPNVPIMQFYPPLFVSTLKSITVSNITFSSVQSQFNIAKSNSTNPVLSYSMSNISLSLDAYVDNRLLLIYGEVTDVSVLMKNASLAFDVGFVQRSSKIDLQILSLNFTFSDFSFTYNQTSSWINYLGPDFRNQFSSIFQANVSDYIRSGVTTMLLNTNQYISPAAFGYNQFNITPIALPSLIPGTGAITLQINGTCEFAGQNSGMISPKGPIPTTIPDPGMTYLSGYDGVFMSSQMILSCFSTKTLDPSPDMITTYSFNDAPFTYLATNASKVFTNGVPKAYVYVNKISSLSISSNTFTVWGLQVSVNVTYNETSLPGSPVTTLFQANAQFGFDMNPSISNGVFNDYYSSYYNESTTITNVSPRITLTNTASASNNFAHSFFTTYVEPVLKASYNIPASQFPLPLPASTTTYDVAPQVGLNGWEVLRFK